ncbi:hypothetical protein GCM10023162_06860 [Klenkia terrae]
MKRGEYAADLRYVESATESLIEVLAPGELVVGKSTVPVGTAARLAELVTGKAPGALLAWNPEFLREGFAVQDTLHPDRLVYGLPAGADGDTARALLDEVYASIEADGTPQVVTDYATAEMVKTAANSFLATKISFINAMAELCEATGADVKQLADAIGYDDRIGRKFLNAGLGFGGGCLPKDIRAFMARAGELGADQALTFLREVDNINMPWGRRSSPTPTTSATPRRSTSPPSSSCRAPPCGSPTRRPGTTSAGPGRSWTWWTPPRRPPSAPTPSWCSPSGSSSASSTRSPSAGSWRARPCWTGGRRWTATCGRPRAGPTGRWAAAPADHRVGAASGCNQGYWAGADPPGPAGLRRRDRSGRRARRVHPGPIRRPGVHPGPVRARSARR